MKPLVPEFTTGLRLYFVACIFCQILYFLAWKNHSANPLFWNSPKHPLCHIITCFLSAHPRFHQWWQILHHSYRSVQKLITLCTGHLNTLEGGGENGRARSGLPSLVNQNAAPQGGEINIYSQVQIPEKWLRYVSYKLQKWPFFLCFWLILGSQNYSWMNSHGWEL